MSNTRILGSNIPSIRQPSSPSAQSAPVAKDPRWLLDHASNKHSQIGEDGVVGKVLSMLPSLDHWCVEFGAWDGIHMSNTRSLIEDIGYRAVLIEADKEKYDALSRNTPKGSFAVHGLVGWGSDDGLDSILSRYPIPTDFDFLSIDIDGNDYHVWEAIVKYNPKVVCVEFNQSIPNEIDWVQPKNPSTNWGCSLKALVRLAKSKDYELISVLHYSAFFVDKRYFHLFGIENNSPVTLRTNLNNVFSVWRGYDGSVHSYGLPDPWTFTALDIKRKPSTQVMVGSADDDCNKQALAVPLYTTREAYSTNVESAPGIPPSPQIADKPLAGLNVLFASPTYGGIDPLCAKSMRVAIMSAASKGLHWAGDVSPDRQSYALARNAVAQIARAQSAHIDGVMWVDSDIVVPPDAIVRLLTTARVNNLDFVTGTYHARKTPFLPVIYHWSDVHGKYLQCVTYPKDKVLTLDACGFGFVYTSTKVINAIADHPDFDPKVGWFPDRRDAGGFGEDISFCDAAKKAGIQLWLDTGVQVGHTADPKVIYESDFRALGITIDSAEIQTRPLEASWGIVPKA